MISLYPCPSCQGERELSRPSVQPADAIMTLSRGPSRWPTAADDRWASRLWTSAHQPHGVSRNHERLIGRDDKGRQSRGRTGDRRCIGFVGSPVGLEAQPAGPLDDRLSDRWAVLADAGGEYEGVEAAQDRGESAELLGNPADEVVNRQSRPRITARQQVANIIADARQPLEPAFLVQQRLHGFSAHAPLVQVEHDTGIE